MPIAPQITIIRHNVFSKAKADQGTTPPRPCVLVGHWPLQGAGAQDLYLVYGNFFYQNPTEALFQGEGRLALYNNVFVNDTGDAIRIQPHNDHPKYVRLLYNTVLTPAAGVTVLRRDGPKPDVYVAGNVILAGRPVSGFTPWNNLIGGYTEASRYLRHPFGPLSELDLSLRLDMRFPLIPHAKIARLSNIGTDINGNPRNANVPGAFGRGPDQPSWPRSLARKFLTLNRNPHTAPP